MRETPKAAAPAQPLDVAVPAAATEASPREAKAAPLVQSGEAVAPSSARTSPRPPTAKPRVLNRPTFFRGGAGGNVIGFLVTFAANLFAGKMQAAAEQRRYEADVKALEPEVAAKLAALTDQVATLQSLAPGRTVYANVTIHVARFEMFIATPDGAFQDDLYMGTTLEGVTVSYQDIKATRHERDGSAARGGTDDLEIATYSQALEPYTVEELIAHARARNLNLTPLRAYVKFFALLEERRAVEASLSPDAQWATDRWLRALRLIDEQP